MPTWTSAELIELLTEDGWVLVGQKGSHQQYKHASKPGRVTLPHPARSIPLGTVRSIYRQAGLEWGTRKR